MSSVTYGTHSATHLYRVNSSLIGTIASRTSRTKCQVIYFAGNCVGGQKAVNEDVPSRSTLSGTAATSCIECGVGSEGVTLPSYAVIGSNTSLTTVEVELDHGRVTPRGNESLPEHANALLTILPAKTTSRDPLIQHPELGKAIFHENPALPLHAEDWPDAHP